ncbi:flagellar protein [Sulfurimonas lithotrophica]|uniref:Flagellar protein n=1 Tax=Sulfurimonas lithotrophica TaxID=2590022 RepID=A0A5P8P3D8_9BACT|nr:flagellar protein [Sulfurimonas lithotrophica]QFR50107.1 flagellar protein [Sulfurimonas lithotrophica]
MLKVFLLLLLTLFSNSLALEISINGAKENHQKYSTLHIRDTDKFLCQKELDDFEATSKVICAFSKEPSQDIKKIQNDFFIVDTKIKNKTFFLIIKPFKKMKLVPVVFDLTKDKSVYSSEIKLSKHWMLIGYDEQIPFIKDEKYNEKAINFPFIMDTDTLPYVGGLDVEGKPVKVKQVEDIKEFIKIKNLYAKKDYERALDKIEDILIEYPNTLFKPEILFYKIKVFDKMDRNEGILKLSKVFLREYSSNDNIAEVLSLTAKAYANLGQGTNADYFFDRLFDEHPNSVYSKWGLLYKGDMLEDEGAVSKAVVYYERALNETNDIDVAVNAAFNLAKYNLNLFKKEKANEYISKILKAKPSFFKEHYNASRDLMEQFLEEKEYKSAADIAGALLNGQGKDDDDAEWLLRSQGVWLSKSENKIEALEPLKKYLKLYEYGLYLDEVQVAKDGLFFDESINDDNISKKLARYDELMELYKGDSIGDRAIYEKAKELNKNQLYKDALDMEDKLLKLDNTIYTDINQILQDAAVGFMKQSLEKRECNEVLVTSNKYKIVLSDEWDDGIYECAMQGSDYTLARKTSTKNLNSKNINHRKKWLYRHIKLDFATGNYSDVLQASKELISLVNFNKESEYLDIYRIIFDTYQRLEQNDNMLKAIADLEKLYGLNYKDIERYIAVMGIGVDKKDNTIVIKYAKDIMNLQNSSKSYSQSPYVEFSIYEAYIDIEEYNKALEVIKSLENIELKPKDRVRQKYLLGSVYTKLWRDEEANKAYDEVIKLDPNSAWAELAKSAKDISK